MKDFNRDDVVEETYWTPYRYIMTFFATLSLIVLTGMYLTLQSALPTAGASTSSELARTVYIVNEAGDEHGSGYLFGKGKVLTAAHVAKIAETGDMYVQRCADKTRCERVRAEVLWVSTAYDIAVLKTSYPAVNPLLMDCNRQLQVGENVRWSGFPGSFEFPSMYYGRVSRVAANDDGPLHLWKDTALVGSVFIPGNSGGPVFDDNGAFLGVVVGSHRLYPMGYMVPARVVCSLFGHN